MDWYPSTTLLAALVSVTVSTVVIFRRILRHRVERKGCPLPPGPTGLPLLGSALSVDSHRPWLTYTEWRETYGEYSRKCKYVTLTWSFPR